MHCVLLWPHSNDVSLLVVHIAKKSVNAVVPNALSHLVFLNTVETRFKLFSVRLTTAATVTTCDAYLLTVAITTTVT